MKRQLFLIPLLISAASLVHAATYRVTIADPVVVDGKELKAGDYKVEVNDTTAVLRNGKDSTEVKVTTESNSTKYNATSVRFQQEGGKNKLQEIHIGGTKTKLVIDSAKTANGGV
jgi:hypothetical protein